LKLVKTSKPSKIMKLTKIINLLLIALLSLFTLQNALAQKPRFNSIDDFLSNPDSRQAFNIMAKGHKIPEWIFSEDKVITSVKTASFKGHDNVIIAWACKAHACYFEQIVLMYVPDKGKMYGLLFKGELNSNLNEVETLKWLNINYSDSEDGKAIMYAAITGSLSSHPDNFKFNSK
jgi:hypothetical protein